MHQNSSCLENGQINACYNSQQDAPTRKALSWSNQLLQQPNQPSTSVTHTHLKDKSKSQRKATQTGQCKSQRCSQRGFGQSQCSASIFVPSSIASKNQNFCARIEVKLQSLINGQRFSKCPKNNLKFSSFRFTRGREREASKGCTNQLDEEECV